MDDSASPSNSNQYSKIPDPLPGPPEQIAISRENKVLTIALNRPRALNSLSCNMFLRISKALLSAKNDDQIAIVILKAAKGRAFCAGGDIKDLFRALSTPPQVSFTAQQYLYHEYRMDSLIYDYPKPIISLINGLDMGGGTGFSLTAKYRVATEHAQFAMPECAIGWFPDAGGLHWLSKLPQSAALYAGLTGNRISVADTCRYGITSHFIPSSKIDLLEKSLSSGGYSTDTIENYLKVESILSQNCVSYAKHVPSGELYLQQKSIKRCFSDKYSLKQIIQALNADPSDSWAKNLALNFPGKRSPTSCLITLRALNKIYRDKCTFHDAIRLEFRLAINILQSKNEFREGIRAMVVDKDRNPRWNTETNSSVNETYVIGVVDNPLKVALPFHIGPKYCDYGI